MNEWMNECTNNMGKPRCHSKHVNRGGTKEAVNRIIYCISWQDVWHIAHLSQSNVSITWCQTHKIIHVHHARSSAHHIETRLDPVKACYRLLLPKWLQSKETRLYWLMKRLQCKMYNGRASCRAVSHVSLTLQTDKIDREFLRSSLSNNKVTKCFCTWNKLMHHCIRKGRASFLAYQDDDNLNPFNALKLSEGKSLAETLS